MKPRKFIGQLDHPAIEAAIARAEGLTSGEIRVVVTHRATADPVCAAQESFIKLGMDKTRERNAVLIFIAPASHTFAVIGDQAVHEKCGDAFWQELAAAMTGFFKEGKFTEGLAHGIERAGTLLAGHFPRQSDDTNELPDGVIEQ